MNIFPEAVKKQLENLFKRIKDSGYWLDLGLFLVSSSFLFGFFQGVISLSFIPIVCPAVISIVLVNAFNQPKGKLKSDKKVKMGYLSRYKHLIKDSERIQFSLLSLVFSLSLGIIALQFSSIIPLWSVALSVFATASLVNVFFQKNSKVLYTFETGFSFTLPNILGKAREGGRLTDALSAALTAVLFCLSSSMSGIIGGALYTAASLALGFSLRCLFAPYFDKDFGNCVDNKHWGSFFDAPLEGILITLVSFISYLIYSPLFTPIIIGFSTLPVYRLCKSLKRNNEELTSVRFPSEHHEFGLKEEISFLAKGETISHSIRQTEKHPSGQKNHL